MSAESQAVPSSPLGRWLAGIALAGVFWLVAYSNLTVFADSVIDALRLSRETLLGEAAHFFVYDAPKVLLLLAGIVFVMGIVQTFFAPERTRATPEGQTVFKERQLRLRCLQFTGKAAEIAAGILAGNLGSASAIPA